ncbi:MAG: hypothetical protein OXF02_03010 [Simkaniaceae bacterium]|nr:hypothetical protein [Simkaniaceae bacterium]
MPSDGKGELPLIVSYYTEGTGYEREVLPLIASCKRFGLESEIEGVPSRGRWDRNCAYKPRFLIEKAVRHKRALVWVDADATFLRYPDLFRTLSCDMALRVHDALPVTHPSKVLTGTIYLAYTEAVLCVLDLWDRECRNMLTSGLQEVWDQVALKCALASGPEVAFATLPESYCAIRDKSTLAEEEVIISHRQASRLLKRVVDGEVIPFWLT